MSTDVFISYRRSDRDWAERLCERLQDLGVSVWYDGMIDGGEDWRDEIVENIRLARILVILLSAEANASRELKKELSVADEGQTLIVVVRVENVEPEGGYAYELSSRNWLDVFDNPPKQLAEAAEVLKDALAEPENLEQRFSKSVRELIRRRRRRMFGSLGLLRNNLFLVVVFLLVSLVLFFVYDTDQNAISEMTSSGATTWLQAVCYAGFLVSFGSPLLLISSLGQDLSGIGYLLIPLSLINVLIMILWVRNFFSWIHFIWARRKA